MADSKIAVYGAIAANVAIAATKFVVAGVTGSSAMLSEGIHSAVDTGNGVLLLIGRRLSERRGSMAEAIDGGLVTAGVVATHRPLRARALLNGAADAE